MAFQGIQGDGVQLRRDPSPLGACQAFLRLLRRRTSRVSAIATVAAARCCGDALHTILPETLPLRTAPQTTNRPLLEPRCACPRRNTPTGCTGRPWPQHMLSEEAPSRRSCLLMIALLAVVVAFPPAPLVLAGARSSLAWAVDAQVEDVWRKIGALEGQVESVQRRGELQQGEEEKRRLHQELKDMRKLLVAQYNVLQKLLERQGKLQPPHAGGLRG